MSLLQASYRSGSRRMSSVCRGGNQHGKRRLPWAGDVKCSTRFFDWILSGNHNFYTAKWQENRDLVSVLPLISCMALDFLCTKDFSSQSAQCGRLHFTLVISAWHSPRDGCWSGVGHRLKLTGSNGRKRSFFMLGEVSLVFIFLLEMTLGQVAQHCRRPS